MLLEISQWDAATRFYISKQFRLNWFQICDNLHRFSLRFLFRCNKTNVCHFVRSTSGTMYIHVHALTCTRTHTYIQLYINIYTQIKPCAHTYTITYAPWISYLPKNMFSWKKKQWKKSDTSFRFNIVLARVNRWEQMFSLTFRIIDAVQSHSSFDIENFKSLKIALFLIIT